MIARDLQRPTAKLINTFRDARLLCRAVPPPVPTASGGAAFWHHRGGHGGVPAFAHRLGLVRLQLLESLQPLRSLASAGDAPCGLAKPSSTVTGNQGALCGLLKWPPRVLLSLYTSAMNILRFSDLCAQGKGLQPARLHPCRPECAAETTPGQYHRRHPASAPPSPPSRMALDAGAAVMVTSHLGRPDRRRVQTRRLSGPRGQAYGRAVGPWSAGWCANWVDAVRPRPGRTGNCRLNVGEKKNKEESRPASWPRHVAYPPRRRQPPTASRSSPHRLRWPAAVGRDRRPD